MKKRLQNKLRLLIVLTLLLISLTSYAVGKYATTVKIESNVTFTAKLAQNFELRESRINRKADGTYETLGETVTNETQSYILLPGVDVPKDPHIVITGKTKIPAYLYIEVVDNTGNGALSYSLTENWISSDREAKIDGATVYVYSTDKTKPAEITSDLTAYIVENNKITVSQSLNAVATNDLLTFYAYLEEVVPANP